MSTKAGYAPRAAALDILQAVHRGRLFDDALASVPVSMAARDRHLATRLAAGVLQERRMLDIAIDDALSRADSVSPRLRDVLRLGVYQLTFLDRVPPHAAVSTTVELAKKRVGARVAPLVNAVLRQITRAPLELSATPQATLAQRYSHPDWLVERWIAHFGETRTERLLVHNNSIPVVTVQSARWTETELEDAFIRAGIAFTRPDIGPGLTVNSTDVTQLPGYDNGAFIVQAPTQRRLLEFASVPKAAVVWDVCAAPGGKAIPLSLATTVICTDISFRRLQRLQDNLLRVSTCVPMVVADARRHPMKVDVFDAVIVDAPCTGTGAMVRHPDSRWSLNAQRLRAAVDLQREILDAVADTVRPGGSLSYLTCSLEPEENKQQVDGFLERRTDFRRIDDDVFVFPGDADSDGGFGARVSRVS